MATKGNALIDADSNLPLTGGGLSTVGVLSRTSGIDGTSVGTTNLYTVPTGRSAIITGAIARLTAAATVSTVAIAGIGVAAGEDDIFASQSLTGLNTTTELFEYVALGTKVIAASGEVIKFGIDTAYIAGTATISIDLIGYLI